METLNLKHSRELDLSEWETWDQRSKEKFLQGLAVLEGRKKVWYCKRGRTCDGKPHEGAPDKHARGDQWPPADKDWVTWLLKGGRGSGKTKSGSEWSRKMSETVRIGSIIGPTISHIREFMVEGDSGLLAAFDNARITALWEPSKRRITLPKGHIIRCFSGDEPGRLRGPEHGFVWLDEPAHIPLIQEVWDMMMFGLRSGERPLILCTTTPLPTKWMKDLIAEEDTRAVTVSSYANIDNLSPVFRKKVIKKYEGTRLGRQELFGEVLEDVEGALWTMDIISENRILVETDPDKKGLKAQVTVDMMDRLVIGIDPSGTSTKKRDETGIIAVGKMGDHYYVFYDKSGTYTPNGWATKAWKLFDNTGADLIVAEKNYGGEMVLNTLTNVRRNGNVQLVHSRRGKELRAEPIVGIYEQKRVHHVGIFPELEEQMTQWVPGHGSSPDRVDALVHAMTELSQGEEIGESNFAGPTERPFAQKSPADFLQKNILNLNGPKLFGWQPREATPAVFSPDLRV